MNPTEQPDLWTLTTDLLERLARAGIYIALDGGELKAFGPDAALERHADLIRANRTPLTHRLRARLFVERDWDMRALESFCRPDCPHLHTFTLMSDNGPARQCLSAGGGRLYNMTACPRRAARQTGG